MSSCAGRLLERRAKLFAEIQRGRVPAWARADLIEHLELSLAASRGRAEAAAQRSIERSAAIRARIRVAVGVLPLDYELSTLVAIVTRRLGDQAPAARTIRSELLAMRNEKNGVSELKRQRGRVTVVASSPPQAGDARR